MYTNEKNPGINWKDLIVKAIFTVIFVLLLVWLFPKVPNMTPFYSNVFRENLKYMQESAQSYYTNERLPKNVGETAELTLQEMIVQDLILPFVDKDGKECDTNESYAQVTKNSNDYTLAVNLVCPSEKHVIKKTLGCYNYCEDCQKKEAIEYQFKRAVTSYKASYSCPNGGTLKGTSCNLYTKMSYLATENKSADSYFCLDGSDPVNRTCNVTETKVSPVKRTTEYTCPEGKLIGDKCEVSTKTTVDAYVENYTCNGKITTSKTCSVKSSGSSYPAVTKTFKSTTTRGTSYTLVSQGYEYTCSNHAACPKRVYYYTYSYLTCPNGGSLSGSTCIIKDSKITVNGTPNYKCLEGELSGTKCIIETSKLVSADKDPLLSKEYCDNGVMPKNGVCTYLENKTIDAQKRIGNTYFTCPKGGSIDGKTCSLTVLSSSYKATVSTKAVTSYEYKWAEVESVDGWERTGETRVKSN